MQSDKRKGGGPLGYAFAFSLLVNTACVAMVGTAALWRPAHHAPATPRGRDTSSLHPAPLQMADAGRVWPGGEGTQGQTGEAGNTSGIGESQTAGAGRTGSRTGKGTRGGESQKADDGKAPLTQVARRREMAARAVDVAPVAAQQAKAGRPLTAAEAKRAAALNGRHIGSKGTEEKEAPQTGSSSSNPPGTAGRAKPPQGETAPGGRHKGMAVVRRPPAPGRNGHAGSPGDSIAPKMVKYPRMKLDLGTVHMTRPTRGVTGGGSADLRQVDIKVHYVVDDPKNVPKMLLPDKIVRMFPTRCNGDPGNTSKCLPTGGNTRLGGTVLHGSHDQITGVKYCVPGGGGVPSGGSGASQGNAASRRAGGIISQMYHGRGPASSGTAASKTSSGAARGGASSHTDPYEQIASVIHAQHLPSAHGDFRGQTPGAEVPVADRRWVSNPEAHTDSAPPGARTAPMPRFSAAVQSVGSLSRSGTVDWGRPAKARRKKATYGGDGSGLLGMYYHGNAFNQLAFTRPDRNIDFDWSAGPPDPRIAPGTEYSVRWLGEIVPKETDTYTLMVTSDDGARLYVGGRLLIANWTTHSPTEDTATVRLKAGQHYAIKLEYYENSLPPAAIRLYWEAASVPRQYISEQCLRYPKTRP